MIPALARDALSYRDEGAVDDLAGEIELADAEYSNGDISEATVKSRLGQALHAAAR